MIDTHAHINISPLIDDIDGVIQRAMRCGVEKIICIGINQETNQLAIELAEKYKQVYASVGIHPSECDEDVSYLELLSHPKVVAIGEIGIDLYWKKDNLDLQIKRFKEQLFIAQKEALPVIIHSRNSSDVIYDIIKDYNVTGVMHCYSEHIDLLDKYLALGFYIGVGGIVTFKNANLVLDIVNKTPLDRLLLETDSPYLAPVPYRGKTNEPKNTLFVLEKVAEQKQISKAALDAITTTNANTLFSKLSNTI
ncbi:MAG: TatD family hydrolase [Acholeplasmataceae bacterium]